MKRRVEIHLGALCNNKCVFCVSAQARDDKDPWARFEFVKSELEHFRAQGCDAVGFLGGEPTVYPKIVECVAYARRLGYERIALCSNGMRFGDAAFTERLVEAGMTRVTISIHSHRPEVEDGLITLVPGNFARKVAGIRRLVELRARGRLKDNVSLNPVLCRPTMGEMAEYLAFFSGLGIDDVRFNYIWPEGDVGEDPSWIPSFREAMPHVVRLLLLNERTLKLRLSFGGVPKCVLRLPGASARLADYLRDKYLDEAVFDPDNDVSILTDGGPLGRVPQRFIWQERKKQELKRRAEGCARCRWRSRCEGVWRTYADLYGLSELAPEAAA